MLPVEAFSPRWYMYINKTHNCYIMTIKCFIHYYVSLWYTEEGTCCFTCVCSMLSVSMSVPFISVKRFLSCRLSNKRLWPNAEPTLAHWLRRWANNSPVLGHRVVFGAKLNVGQRHRRRGQHLSSFGSKQCPGTASMPVLPAWSTD